jgi:hypothetical protein
VVLVSSAGLGMINDVRLCSAALAPVRPLVMVNRFEDDNELHVRNMAWLREVDGYEVVTAPDQVATWIMQRHDRPGRDTDRGKAGG